MLYRVSASKDTFITDLLSVGRRATGSNIGASEILELFKVSSMPQSGSIANILMLFPTASALAAYSASFTGSAPEWRLTLKNVETANPGIGSFDIEILPLERSWDEGKGHDADFWTNKGFANWVYAKNGDAWTNQGARPTSASYSASFHFEDGHEDVDVNIGELALNAQYGLWIGITSSQVADTNDYYLKAFRSRQTHFPQYAPALELRWNDATGSYTTSSMLDSTGTLIGNIYNLQSVYDRTETPILRTYFRVKDWNMAVVTTASTDTTGTLLTNGYYRVVNDITDEIVVPFGTGSPAYTKMSYNTSGNYFKFYMSNLVPNIVYRFDIGYFDSANEWHVVHGDDMKFRVR
jgi:hypothetical protein